MIGQKHIPSGVSAGAGVIGSGKRSIESRSSCLAPACSFFACCLLIYCIISSSPNSSSSSTELGAGEGVDNDCLLVEGVPIVCWMLGVDEELDDRAVGRDILGLRSLRPLEGERAEKR